MEFDRHFSRYDLEKLFDGFTLPEGFLFGVANAGFQVEGGFNGPGEPLNNWVEYERSGKAERSGEAIRFWTDYPETIEVAQSAKLNGFRLGVEWARVQPQSSAKFSGTPEFDYNAIEAYSDMIAALMNAGMEPVVTLHHFVHPYWAGMDFWLENGKLDLFQEYVEVLTGKLNKLLIEKHTLRPVKYYITLNEPNGYGLITYMVRFFPHHKSGLNNTMIAWNNMIEGHCRAYDSVHRVYKDNGWESPLVGYNPFQSSVYLVDKLMTDLLNARRNGIERGGLSSYIEKSRAAWDEEIARCPEVEKPHWLNMKVGQLLNKLADRLLDTARFKTGIDAIYSSPEPNKLDYLGIDFYDPFPGNLFKLPTVQDIREKRFNFNSEHWEWILNPRAMYHFLKAETINTDGLSLILMENGMSNKVYNGRVEQRPDGATRDKFLQSFIFEAMRAVKDGVPLKGYFYWSLADNYEWGSYEPRFGLLTVDRSRPPVRLSSVDAWGVNAVSIYGELIAALQSGERERIVEAFLKDDR